MFPSVEAPLFVSLSPLVRATAVTFDARLRRETSFVLATPPLGPTAAIFTEAIMPLPFGARGYAALAAWEKYDSDSIFESMS